MILQLIIITITNNKAYAEKLTSYLQLKTIIKQVCQQDTNPSYGVHSPGGPAALWLTFSVSSRRADVKL